MKLEKAMSHLCPIYCDPFGVSLREKKNNWGSGSVNGSGRHATQIHPFMTCYFTFPFKTFEMIFFSQWTSCI